MPPKPAMPKWTKAPPALVELFAELIAPLEGAEPRKMFGYPAAFVNGNLFGGRFQPGLTRRLPPAERGAIGALGALPFEPMPGRAMREYVAVPESLASGETLRLWIAKAFAFG